MTIKQLKHLTLLLPKGKPKKIFSDLDSLADYLNKPVATALTKEVKLKSEIKQSSNDKQSVSYIINWGILKEFKDHLIKQ